MYIIGLTGGIACGKSAVAREFRRLGAKTFDIDRVTHKLLERGGLLYSAYVQHFGDIILDADGELNRRIIADILFNNEDQRQWINSVAHPLILNYTRDFLVDAFNAGESLVVLEIPLLFEVGWEFLVDEVWAVYISRSQQIWRLTQRDQITYEEAVLRIDTQMSAKEIAARADAVIRNNNTERNAIRKHVMCVLHKRFPSFYKAVQKKLKKLKRQHVKNKSEVSNLAENQEKNICSNNNFNSDNLRGATVAANAEDSLSVPVS